MDAIAMLKMQHQEVDELFDRIQHAAADEKITLRHLATHTSGLPDMLPENQALIHEAAAAYASTRVSPACLESAMSSSHNAISHSLSPDP